MRDSPLAEVQCGKEEGGPLESFDFSLGSFLVSRGGPPSVVELATGAECHLDCAASQLCEPGPAILGFSVLISPLRKLGSQ